MKYRKTVLAVAAAALTFPAALATASTAASAGGIVPQVPTVSADIPPVCHYSEVQPTCTTINNTDNQGHTATFSGTYTAANQSTNTSSTCVEGSKTIGANTCKVTFTGGNPATLCNPANTTTPWYQAPAGNLAWIYVPATSDASQTLSGDRLFAEGGGIVDFQSVTPQQDGSLLIYRIHIQINSMCGNEDTAQNLTDTVTAGAGEGPGAVDLSKTYKFTGYIDVL